MEEAFQRLKGNKSIKLNYDVVVEKIKILNDLDLIEINIVENKNLYENLSLKKAEIFPLPKENDTLNIKEMLIDYDENLVLRILIKAEIKSHAKKVNDVSKDYKNSYSFYSGMILETLINIIGIKEKIFSSIFIVKGIQGKFYILFSLKDLKTYKISIEKISLFSINEFMLVLNYNILEDDEIVLNNITIVDKLSEEKLFQFYFSPEVFGNKLSLFKIIDINDKYYIAVNHNKKIFQIIKNDNHHHSLEIKICQLLLILNDYKIIEHLKYNLEIIQLNENSIIYKSVQEIYFSKLILINFFTAINIHFLDYNKNNYYNTIIIENNEFNINEDEQYFVVSCSDNDYDFYSTEIILQKSKEDKNSTIFYFFIYKGLLNKINAFINNYQKISYFIEYYFMSIDSPIQEIDTKKIIEINNKKYELKKYDNFGSLNRKRYNVLNVPYQKIDKFNEKDLLSKWINSIQISNFL